MDIYKRIKIRREELNMSQDELATKMGYKNRSTITKIESGINDIPQSKIKAFADALQTTPAYLMGWDKDSPTDHVEREWPTKSDLELLARFHKLNPVAQQTVLNLISSLEQMGKTMEQAARNEVSQWQGKDI